jgi:ParB family transcriptional regulator, chromosome partitioning protein
MTSGNFKPVLIDSIVIDRETRQRKELRGIEELAESMHRLGLIHPIVIDSEYKLIAGERRLTAAKLLGWTHIPVQFKSDIDELTSYAIELEENVKRLDITWQERALAMDAYAELRRKQEGGMTQTEVAKELGLSSMDVSRNLAVASALKNGNERVTKADKFSTALNIVEREASRKADSALASAVSSIEIATKLPEDEATSTVKKPPLLNEDFNEWAAAYCGRPFNLIHCDFPYGVGMHRSDQGAGQEFGEYKDSPDVYWKLLETLKMGMDNVVADSAHLIFWFSMDFYQRTLELLTAMGWHVNPFPLVWLKSDNTGIIPDANRGPRRIYETAFFASRGDRKIVSAVANAFAHPGKDKSIHMNEKPVPMLKHFLRMVTDEYSFVLDPTAGSANALKAATELQASAVLGLERDPEFFQRSCDAYYNETEL